MSEKKNKKLAKKYGYDRHYYLEQLGWDIRKCGTNFCDNEDKRYKKWMHERKKYGFDSRETWHLDGLFLQWLYEHLKMYKKEASKIVDLSYHKFDVNGKEYTQKECIDKMIKDLKYILTHDDWDEDVAKKMQKKINRVLDFWKIVFSAMWW